MSGLAWKAQTPSGTVHYAFSKGKHVATVRQMLDDRWLWYVLSDWSHLPRGMTMTDSFAEAQENAERLLVLEG